MRSPPGKMLSSSRSNRTIIPKNPAHRTAYVKICTEQDPVMFKDPIHVHEWMATAGHSPSTYPGVIPPLPMEQAVYDESYPRFHAPGTQKLPLDVSLAGYDSFLYGSNYSAAAAPPNMHLHSDSFSSEDESLRDFNYDVPSSADMVYSRSNQSAAFTGDYSTSPSTARTTDPYSQASFSAPTAWSSPSSTAMEPSFMTPYTTPGLFPCLITSPQVGPASDDLKSVYPGYEDNLPASMLNNHSPAEYSTVDSLYTNMSTIRPARDQVRGSIADHTFWPPVEPTLEMNIPTGSFAHVSSRPGKHVPVIANPRDHHFYQMEANVYNGLYYCPFGSTEGCRHKPDKLKCNYDKHLDSHLKPYRCKHNDCSSVPFSSTACLLRHEREAHGMHGHGSNPFKCPYSECDRGRGFPRRYNLEDHMKRVHGFEPTSNSRRRSAVDHDTSKAATIRPTKRRSTTTAATTSFPSMDQAASRTTKHSSTRGSGPSRRKSAQ